MSQNKNASQRKPRVWWVCSHGNWYDDEQTALDEQSQDALTHVVEMAYAEDLEKLVEVFKLMIYQSKGIRAVDFPNEMERAIAAHKRKWRKS